MSLKAAPIQAPRLYLITPPLSKEAFDLPLSVDLMAACGVACLLVQMASKGNDEKERIFHAVAGRVQKKGIACLVADDPELCLQAKADGVHMRAEGEQFEKALRMLKPGLIVGAGDLRTRHAAMAAGEAGADYVMFGETGEPQPAVLERTGWWAELFTVPCVGFAEDLDSIRGFAGAGADFIALCGAIFFDPRGAESALREAAAHCLAPPAAGP
ncbi:MAG: thiamine phosphate synthase [Methylocapsa sp.]|nr:thiamine phosphate synthase [Methylocapsa sp.]